MQGSLRLFGGFEPLKEKLEAGLGELGFEWLLAAANTPRAALWLARGDGAGLEALPVEVTRFDAGFFRNIGITTIGELLQLPREGLAQRCGVRLLEELDQALGAVPEPRRFFAPPARFAAGLELPAEVVHAEGVLFGARRLLAQLEGLLTARQEGIRNFRLVLLHENHAKTVEVGLASPARDAGRLAQLLRERLGRIALTGPVSAIRLEAGAFAPLPGRSGGLFGDPAAAESWMRLLERLRARLGHDAVHGLAAQPDHRPEHAWRRVEPGEWEPREFRQPGPRPLWLVEEKKLSEDEFTLLAGPERIESGWWDGDDAKRDYFIARLHSSMVWIYREDGAWHLHGFFA